MLSSRAIYCFLLWGALSVGSFLPSPVFSKGAADEFSPETAQQSAKTVSVATSSKASETTSTATSTKSDSSSASDSALSDPSIQINHLLERLAINQGKGQFTQQKHFSFMSVPITSTGRFIVKGHSALWQTQQPVFSALLLTPEAIYRRLSLDDNYQLLTDSVEFSGVLATIFTGRVDTDDWRLKSGANDDCLELTPKSGQLEQLFKQVDLCLIYETQMHDPAEQTNRNTRQQRQITLTDSKGDKTVIKMILSNETFLSEDLEALKLTDNPLGNVNDR